MAILTHEADPACAAPEYAPNPRWDGPCAVPATSPACSPECSLVESLGGLVDEIRQMAVDLGTRPYKIYSVVACWTGGEIGRGEECVRSEVEIVPTPLVRLDNFRQVMTQGGASEEGGLTLTEISPRYTEDEIVTHFYGHPLPPGCTGYIEMRMDGRDGYHTPRRRFIVSGTPIRNADKFEWTVKLTEQVTTRNRAGAALSWGALYR